MATIRIDEEVWAALQLQAQPFVDTPNDVLRRLLDLGAKGELQQMPQVNPSATPVRITVRREGRIARTPEAAFRLPILSALEAVGGAAHVRDVLDRVKMDVESQLLPDDYRTLPSNGEVRWENTAKWARKHMVDEGLLSAASRHGVWEITEQGRRYLEQERSR